VDAPQGQELAFVPAPVLAPALTLAMLLPRTKQKKVLFD
jgi:hypothetical protein